MMVRDAVLGTIGYLDRQDNGRIDQQRVAAALITAASEDTEPQVTVTSLEQMEYLGGDLVGDEVTTAIATLIGPERSRRVRVQACITAGMLGDESVLPLLKQTMDNPFPKRKKLEDWEHRDAVKIRRAARKAAARLGDAPSLAAIRAEISSEDKMKQFEAIEDIAYAKDKKAVKLLIPFLDKVESPVPHPELEYDNLNSRVFRDEAVKALDIIVHDKEYHIIRRPLSARDSESRATEWKVWWNEHGAEFE